MTDMIRLQLSNGEQTIQKVFESNEVTLVPEEGLETGLDLCEPLKVRWQLEWSPSARLNLSLEEDGTLLAINETRDQAIRLKGNTLTSAYLMPGDALQIGKTQIIWGLEAIELHQESVAAPPEQLDTFPPKDEAEFQKFKIEELINEVGSLLEEHAKTRAPRTWRDHLRVYLAGLVAVGMLTAALMHSWRADPVSERAQQLGPIAAQISALLESDLIKPEPELAQRLEGLIHRYQLTASYLEGFPDIRSAATLPELSTAVRHSMEAIERDWSEDALARLHQTNQLNAILLERLDGLSNLEPSLEPAAG